MRHNKGFKTALAATLTTGLLGVGCQSLPTQVQAGNSAVEVEIPISIPGNAVCGAFGSDTYGGRDRGLIGSLYYVPSDARNFHHVQNYISQGTRLNADLYFNQINVPTRSFDEGFTTQDNTLLKTPQGDTLYEYFALNFRSEIGLGRQNAPGLYQFALLADDGAVLQVNDSGTGLQTLVDNDGTHPSRFACASRTVMMNAGTRLPIQLDYYQGPRFHIAFVVLWRRINNPDSSLSDPACGLEGNDRFFDYTQKPSAATPTWIDMLSRGWTVLNSSNYYLPAGGVNPCAPPGGCTGPDCGPGSNGS